MITLFRQYYPIRNILFVIAESVFIFTSLFVAVTLFNPGFHFVEGDYICFNIIIITLVCQVCIYFTDLYDMKNSISLKILGVKLVQSLIMASIFLGILYISFPELIIEPKIFVFGVTLMGALIFLIRILYSWVLKEGFFNQRIMILGSGELATKIIAEINERKDCGYEISYMVQNQTPKKFLDNSGMPVISKMDYSNICEIAKEMGIRTIVVAIEEKRGHFPSAELLRCRIDGCEILDGNSFYEMLSGKLVVDQLYPSWLIFSNGFRKSIIKTILKRTLDIAMSLVMLIVFLPLMILVALIIKIDSRGPVFYSQERVGQKHKTYNIYKFRSMIDNAEKTCGPIYACEDDYRVTRVGYYLRKLRIDEMPQLWNVLKGEMSFVGPRPERGVFVREYEKQIPYYLERFSIKPGITGWAQICFRYGADAEDTLEKLNYDLFYIKNMSILMDIMIIMKTIKIVIFGTGAR